MIKLFRNIRKKLLKEGKTANYVKYVIGEIVNCPVRDNIWVAKNRKDKQRAFRYEIYTVPNGTESHCNNNLLPM